MSVKEHEATLAYLAYHTFTQAHYLMDEAEVIEHLESYWRQQAIEVDGETLLPHMIAHHSLLVEQGYQVYGFVHTTLHEYFTAKYIVTHLADHDSLQTLLRQYLKNDRWREAWVLMAEMFKSGDTFMQVFRERLDDFITSDGELTRLIQWVDEHVQQISTPNSSSVLRLAYLTIHIDRASARAFNRARVLAFGLTHNRTFDRVLGLAGDLGYGRELGLARTRDIALAPAHDLGADLWLDFNLLYLWQLAMILAEVERANFVEYRQKLLPELRILREQVIALSEPLQQLSLTQALSQLPLPTEDNPQAAWLEYANQLRQIMKMYRDFGHEWHLNKEQVEQLDRYFKANELFLRCLELAYVSDREGLREGLLRLLK